MSEAVQRVLFNYYFPVLGLCVLFASVVGLVLAMMAGARQREWQAVFGTNFLLWAFVVPGIIWLFMVMFGPR